MTGMMPRAPGGPDPEFRTRFWSAVGRRAASIRELEDLLGARVDVVPGDGLKTEARPEIEADLVAL